MKRPTAVEFTRDASREVAEYLLHAEAGIELGESDPAMPTAPRARSNYDGLGPDDLPALEIFLVDIRSDIQRIEVNFRCEVHGVRQWKRGVRRELLRRAAEMLTDLEGTREAVEQLIREIKNGDAQSR